MKRTHIIAILILLLAAVPARAQEPAPRRIVLTGSKPDADVLRAITGMVPLDSNTTVLFLGDMTGRAADKWSSMDAAAALVSGTAARAIFLPGDREWANGIKTRKEAEAHIESFRRDNLAFYPKNGCAGPYTVDIGDDAILVIMDTQWWLEEGEKPGIESGCPCKNEQQILDKLEDIVSDNRDKFILFAAHHPFKSTGIRSGYFGPRQHIFPLTDIGGLHHAYLPLPVAGSLYPITRSVAISRQDAAHQRYAYTASALEAILGEHPFLLRAAGHEQIMELYQKDGQQYIVSAAGHSAGRVVRTRNTPFVSRHTGFALVEISAAKKVSVVFYEVREGKAAQAYRREIMDFNSRPPMKPAEQSAATPASGDSVAAPVYAKYGEASRMKRFLMGNNYRAEWSAPVTLPRFHLAADPRSFTIVGQGGGKQTTTVRLKDGKGKVWSLRSIVKDPQKVLQPNLRETVAEDVLKDMMSASHPFASLVANRLADAAGIVRPQVDYYYVPDDTALGYYRPAFANTVAALEEHQPSRYGEDTKGTWAVFNDHIEDWKHKVDAPGFLRARLLDILLADFDRHYEQWKWGFLPEGGDSVKTYYAIPKDRDQALFYSDGLLMKIGSAQGMAYLKGLIPDIRNIESLGFVSRDIDAFFLNELTAADWDKELNALQAALSDSVIDAAVAALPPAAYAAHGPRIRERLKSRRDMLHRRGMEYYRFLASHVSIPGSNKAEVFTAEAADSGVIVRVSGDASAGDRPSMKYMRVFNARETDEIRLYGLGGDDRFSIGPNVPRGIRFRVIGGRGQDTFDIQGRAKAFVYDAAGGGNTFLNRRHTVNMISHRRDVNDYAFRENNYSSIVWPTAVLGFNIDDGFMAGLGATMTKRGFRAQPYTAQHRITSLFAFQHRAWQIRYAGTFNDAWRHYDLVVNGAILNPALQNFFGLGNETVRDTALPLRYYRVRYSYVSGDVLARKRAVHNRFSIAIGPSFFYYWNNNDRNSGRILDYPAQYGLDSFRIYSPKFYGGGKFTIDFNSVDNSLLPTRGLRFHADGIAQTGLNEHTLPIYRVQSDLALYAPLSDNKRFILTLRGGGGHIFSDGFEYWQLLTLGANNYLRGYRKNRFSGTSMAFGSAELRWRLARFKARILPGELGIVGFQDGGRVWLRGEDSDKWHLAYGGGIYFTPFNTVLISVLGAVSEEERLMNVSVGAGLNITF
jgi:hypothetical protein